MVANMHPLHFLCFVLGFFGGGLFAVFRSIRSQCEGRSSVARQVLPPEVNDSLVLHYGTGPQGAETRPTSHL